MLPKIYLCAALLSMLVGCQVAIGSAVAMGSMAMFEEEQKQKSTGALAHSVVEKKPAAAAKASRGFAASNQ